MAQENEQENEQENIDGNEASNKDGRFAGNEDQRRPEQGLASPSSIAKLFDGCKVVLFDCDGVLVDSEPISLATLVDVLDHFGAPLSFREVADRFTGRSSSAPIDHIRSQTGTDISAEFKPFFYQKLFARYDTELAKISGIDLVLSALRSRDLAFCISSSSSVERLEKTMVVTGLGPWFAERIYSADFVKNGKPAPDLFLHACADMGFSSSSTIVIEDSVAGVTAAVAAGMKCIGFVGGGHYAGQETDATNRLYDAGADIVISDMTVLAAALAD
ncbi:HAD family hydrolase [Thalassospira povalilytica]|uniref:HAD-IA family hydrolase n=1 Tax=Thalassospira povalilytica TaxID=732237 RepID=A0A8I1M9P3_9PROT|nr:HAD-IA family hydrolase [Thalassospira povalilytica]MBN8197716.1 HAD-IA family hydrolase [Thalassospira povalilytica]